MLDWTVIAVYFGVLLWFGYLGLRRTRSAKDFVLAGQTLGPVPYTSAVSTVVIGGTSTIGGMSLGYQYGISGSMLVVALSLGIMGLGALYALVVQKTGMYTVPQVLGRQYGAMTKQFSSIVVVFYVLMVGVAQLLAIGTIFTVFFDISPGYAILLGFVVTSIYSIAGGMWSITASDVVQFVVMSLGILLVLLPLSVSRAGGLSAMRADLPDEFFSPTNIGWTAILAYLLLFGVGLLVDQGCWQRVATGRSPKVILGGSVVAGLYCIVYGVGAALIGTAARVLYPSLSNPELAFASLVQGLLPAGLLGLVLAGTLAAAMSTLSGMLIGGSAVVADSIANLSGSRRRQTVGSNRIAFVTLSIIALGFAYAFGSVVTALTVAGDFLATTLLVPTMAALFWRRATKEGAIAAAGAGVVVTSVFLVVSGVSAYEPVIYGVIANALVFVTVSLRTSTQESAASMDASGGLVSAEATDVTDR